MPDSATEARRRRLLFRSQHRGTRELDLMVGGFAKARIDGLTEAELDIFAAILDLPDLDIYDWLVGRRPVPPDADSPLLREMIAFVGRGGASTRGDAGPDGGGSGGAGAGAGGGVRS